MKSIKEYMVEWLDWFLRVSPNQHIRILADKEIFYGNLYSGMDMETYAWIAKNYIPHAITVNDGKLTIVCNSRWEEN